MAINIIAGIGCFVLALIILLITIVSIKLRKKMADILKSEEELAERRKIFDLNQKIAAARRKSTYSKIAEQLEKQRKDLDKKISKFAANPNNLFRNDKPNVLKFGKRQYRFTPYTPKPKEGDK
jgi:uncharacterized membrane protein YhiD involved in acid resistance